MNASSPRASAGTAQRLRIESWLCLGLLALLWLVWGL